MSMREFDVFGRDESDYQQRKSSQQQAHKPQASAGQPSKNVLVLEDIGPLTLARYWTNGLTVAEFAEHEDVTPDDDSAFLKSITICTLVLKNGMVVTGVARSDGNGDESGVRHQAYSDAAAKVRAMITFHEAQKKHEADHEH